MRERPRTFHSGAIRAHRKGADPSVNPNHRPSDAGRVRPDKLDRQRHIPAVGLLTAGGRQDATVELAGCLLCLDPADAGQHHRVLLHADGAGQPEPLGTATLLLELGPADPTAQLAASPPVGVGPVEVAQGLLRGALGYLIQPTVAGGALEPVEQPVQVHGVQGLAAALPGLAADGQAPVPGPTCRAGMVGQRRSLGSGGASSYRNAWWTSMTGCYRPDPTGPPLGHILLMHAYT
jgi:hypothetical protein